MGLSVGIITFNEEKRLERTLESVKSFADEVIIVDSGSTDKTHEIAQKFSANFFVESWKGYGLQKNSVIDKCKEDWILLIDADEVISPELKNKIIEMKAAIYTQYGSPEVLQIKEVEKPIPRNNEVLVKIKATAVNSSNWRLQKADPFAVRLFFGFLRPKINILGCVFLGEIESVDTILKSV